MLSSLGVLARQRVALFLIPRSFFTPVLGTRLLDYGYNCDSSDPWKDCGTLLSLGLINFASSVHKVHWFVTQQEQPKPFQTTSTVYMQRYQPPSNLGDHFLSLGVGRSPPFS